MRLRRWLVSAVLLSAAGALRGEDAGAALPGTYRNLSFNVDGAGGAQRLMPALVILPGGAYEWSKEKGRWEVHAGKLRLSGRPAWGDATVNADRQLIFEFAKDGKHFTVTMFRAGDAPAAAAGPATAPPAASAPPSGGAPPTAPPKPAETGAPTAPPRSADDPAPLLDVSFEEKLLATVPAIVNLELDLKQMSFSPDGRCVAYVGIRLDGDKRHWWAVVDGVRGEPFDSVSSPVFSPDAKHVAYFAARDRRVFLCVDGSTGEAFEAMGDRIAFSPDGTKLAFGARKGRELWWKVMHLR